MLHARKDDEIISAIRTETRRSDATLLREMGSHASCTCSARNATPNNHSPGCPIFIWDSAARALDLLAED